jgi:hypothetical protein
MLLETRKGAIFIRIEEPPGMQRSGLPFWVSKLGRLVTESHPPMLNHRVVE